MPAYLSPEWFDRRLALLGSLDVSPGVDATVLNVGTGGPEGGVRWLSEFVDGRLVANGLAAKEVVPTHTVTVGFAQDREIALGQVDANAAYMAGTTKVEGPSGPWFGVLAVLGSPSAQQAVAALAAETDLA